MVRAIMLLSLISLPSFAGDNTISITTKGSGNSITTKQIGNGNDSTILCGVGSSGSVPGSTYVAHTCTNANWNITIDGNSNTTRMYTVWSNNIGSTNTITIDGNDNFAYIDQDEDDNTSSITQTGNSNHAEQLGTGDDNVYSITQIGNNKYAKIMAFGDNSDFAIYQSGTGLHNTYIWNNNYADNNSVVVTQSGSGNKDADIFSQKWVLADFVKALAKLPLQFQPGTTWEYSHSTDVLGRVVEVASGTDGVYGCRMTGGGFGGSTVTLCESSKAAEIAATLSSEYEKATGITPQIFASRPSQGAHLVK